MLGTGTFLVAIGSKAIIERGFDVKMRVLASLIIAATAATAHAQNSVKRR